ncbi:sigma factor-like helix-turn-helix DNA-binding protein [Actinoplanes utahensis]|uniref:sigma factor-like helix-turn-helix DNA-binding protein n=1 Tax=Actinoplanes utahensis TaxID=1869 RepID=UPI000A4296DC|nr:sigma factor-like helix-turn-helix DNA-binding protein [Actinoplanes utahensis]GIF30043.1 hypothetical protein Aut01nite_30290 [Actinoplanes utahensis]
MSLWRRDRAERDGDPGHSVETVAEILGVSTSVVKMRSMRALARLRELLGADGARH